MAPAPATKAAYVMAGLRKNGGIGDWARAQLPTNQVGRMRLGWIWHACL